MSRRFGRVRLLVALLGVLIAVGGGLQLAAPANAAGSVHAPINGSGSTWSANALQQWIRNVFANYQWKITYSESGSTQGRNDFANGTSDFGVSEIPYAIGNSNEGDTRPNRGFAYMPIVAGGTSFMYNLQIAGRRVTNLRLSGEVLAKIFTGVISTWNDPAIAADNPALALPAIPIVPVVRSDGSGATAQFTIWMRQEQSALWDAYCAKVGRPVIGDHCGVTSNYPVQAGSGFVARAGSNGVAGYVAQPQSAGAITFVEYSYALNSGFPVVKMLNNSGYYSEPTAPNVAVALLRAHINEDAGSPDYLTQDLRDVYGDGDPRTYPLSSYSYIILPTDLSNNFTEDKGMTLADFGAYFLCEGQQQADVLGYSPLPINLVQAGQSQIKKIPGGNPQIKGINDCNNPTFTPDGSNRLANEAPLPPDCDRQGPSQCLTGTGGAKGTDTAPSANDPAAAAETNGAGPAATGTGPAGGAGPAGPSGQDPGAVDTGKAPTVLTATPQVLAATGAGPVPAIAALGGGGGLALAAVLPPLLTRRRRRPGAPAHVRAEAHGLGGGR